MRAEIEVLQPGLFSTIQDEGRIGFLNFGVPMSGPMDIYAARFGNLILNNSPDAPVLEITQTGPALKFLAPANIVITGGNFSPRINSYDIKNDRIFPLKTGDILSFGKRKFGLRAYLSIQGGFKSERILGSCSWYEGLTSQYRLSRGMKLYFESGLQKEITTSSAVRFNLKYFSKDQVQVSAGPEFLSLPPHLQKELCRMIFTVDPANNRMAIQLKEKFQNTLKPIITGPVIPGTVQLTPSGKVIVLMRDCQTTGGYPRVLQVDEEGLNILSQKITGEKVQFELIASSI